MKAAWCAVLGIALVGTAAAQSHSDKEFLEKSSQGNVTEVETAKLALKKSQNPEVRSFAQRMIKDHQTLGKKMAPFIAQAGLKPSYSLNTEHQHLYNELNEASGQDFDHKYVEAMVKDHHEDLKEFHDEANSTNDPKLKVAVASGEQVIAEHTQMIEGIAQKMGVSTGS